MIGLEAEDVLAAVAIVMLVVCELVPGFEVVLNAVGFAGETGPARWLGEVGVAFVGCG